VKQQESTAVMAIYVRLRVPTWCLTEFVVCRDLLDEAKDYHLMPDRRGKLHTFKTRPRCCSDVAGVIYAVGGLTSLGEFFVHRHYLNDSH